MTNPPGLNATLATVMRDDRGRLLSALIATLRDFELAEEALSDAIESALTHWQRSGIPDNPIGWLLKVARRKAIDRIRRQKRFHEYTPEITHLAKIDEMEANTPTPDIPDERLRLIFTCCHPALEPKTRVALTLRTLGGLTTTEVAAAFLDPEPTMGQRLSRARKKIARAGIPFTTPEPEQWAERLNSVLAVIYLIFNQGYAATTGTSPTRIDLCEEAIYLARLLDHLTPNEPEIEGLLALQLLTHARRKARQNGAGTSIPLEHQNRADWDMPQIDEGTKILQTAIARSKPGPYQIKAAISALHSTAEETDWPQITLLYDSLLRHEPTPIVALNRAVALAETGALKQALSDITALKSDLESYQPFHAARAEYLARDGQTTAAGNAYERAIALSENTAEISFLQQKRAKIAH